MALKKKVEKNTSVVKRNSDKTDTIMKNGVHVDVKQKVGTAPNIDGSTVVGLAVGTTLNMDNYESLRVDVWISDSLKDGETVEQAYDRLREVVSSQLTETVSEFKED